MSCRVCAGAPAASRAAETTAAVRTDNCGCPEWAFTITEQPAARADAVSPPATEKANGKLLAAKLSTGPTGILKRRTSGRTPNTNAESASSMRTSRYSPASTISANNRNCTAVRVSSPDRRASDNPVSVCAMATSSARTPSRASAAAASAVARIVGVRAAQAGAATAAWRATRSVNSVAFASATATATESKAGTDVVMMLL